MSQGITKQSEDFSRWYTDVVISAKLADYSPVRGSMIIRPYGYALWENMQKVLDGMFKETGHENVYFPLLIPQSFLQKEAEHVEGFAPECAVVTHGGGEELEEPLVIRPTSETIIWSTYRSWIQSYRDLPLLYNQWANVVRWELRTRLFLRTTEFLWQEGHTAHATEEEAEAEMLRMLEVYRLFAEEYMAIPVITGVKTESEKFPGAIRTTSIEAMMRDKKALQSGTSHNLGQNFSKVFDVTFLDEAGNRNLVWSTSWGVTTRLIGAIIMAHGDDQGLMMPPRLAPIQTVIIPIFRSGSERDAVMQKSREIEARIRRVARVKLDDREQHKPGWKFNEWEQAGVPIRLEIGPKDLEKNQVVLVKRDDRKKTFVPMEGLEQAVEELLEAVQAGMLDRARAFREENTSVVNSYPEVKQRANEGFLNAFWCGGAACEAQVKEETKATIRCIPFDRDPEKGRCIVCGAPSEGMVIFAKAY